MKKNILAMAVILNCSFAMAQTEFDALKMIQPDINGTARYMGMAGAFGALGGDASAIKDNPAGLVIYRSSEITTTLDLSLQSSKSVWNDVTAHDNLDNFKFNNFSYVKATPTYRSLSSDQGLLSSNWSFSYNRLKSFNRNSTIKSGQSSSSISDYMAYFTGNIKSADLAYVENSYEPFDNTNVPWLSVIGYENGLIKESVNNNASSWSSTVNTMVTPTYTLHETGYIDEYSIGWAGNFSNRFYLGTTLNVQSIDYNARSIYSETFGGGNGTYLDNNLSTSGTGFNLNIGAIVRPIDMLRLGVSIHTPTIYDLTDNNYTNYGNSTTPTASSDYKLNSPWKFNGSAAVILGQKGLISMEYDYAMNSHAKFYDRDGNAQSFDDENTGIKTMLKDVQTIKIGGEYRLTDNFSLRAGYAYMNGATNNAEAHKLMRSNTTRTDAEYFQNNRTDYITAGFGYREANWYIDFAYMNKNLDETFYPYNLTSVNSASVKTTTNNLIVTLGLKF